MYLPLLAFCCPDDRLKNISCFGTAFTIIPISRLVQSGPDNRWTAILSSGPL